MALGCDCIHASFFLVAYLAALDVVPFFFGPLQTISLRKMVPFILILLGGMPSGLFCQGGHQSGFDSFPCFFIPVLSVYQMFEKPRSHFVCFFISFLDMIQNLLASQWHC